MTQDTDPTAIVRNALHAASTWLQRMGAPADAAAVVTIAPRAAVGAWVPGHPNVRTLTKIDDAGAELCEAVAPIAQRALERLSASAREAVSDSIVCGSRLQTLVAPLTNELAVRLVVIGGLSVEIATVHLVGAMH